MMLKQVRRGSTANFSILYSLGTLIGIDTSPWLYGDPKVPAKRLRKKEAGEIEESKTKKSSSPIFELLK
jgi:hypothetical protein